MKKSFKSLITMLLVFSLLFSNFAMILSSAAIADYQVELAFNNIFVFDKWANNKLSTTIVSGGVPVSDKLNIDIANGSFRFTNNYTTEAYTGHGMGTGELSQGNYAYYMMEVEPDSTYTFSYKVTCDQLFTPYVFFFDENNSHLSFVSHSTAAGTENVNFIFSTPANAKYIQIRFTVANKGYADVSNIAIRKTEIASYGSNIYDFDAWANNSLSGKVSTDQNYCGGTISKNTTENSVTLTTNGAAGVLFTNFTFSNGNGYYMMDVAPGSDYVFSYNLSSCNFAVGFYQPYVVFYDASYNYISYLSSAAAAAGDNKFIFTTPANAEYMQIVYGIVGIAESGKTCTVKDVAIQQLNFATDAFNDIPHRLVYTYSTTNPAVYGTLPTPSYAPDGYVFAGWYTGNNGTGTLITENTPVNFTSYNVYPKYEPIATALAIKTLPVKTSYTVGERVNPTGLVLEATIAGTTRTIDSGYYCTPEYLTSTGTQTITAHYGGQTATYTVNVSASASKSVVVNGSDVNVTVTNNVYTFASTVAASDFTRYELTYYSDAYVRGIITYGDNSTEEFFLEPSSNFEDNTGKFASYVDGYLTKVLASLNQTSHVTSAMKKGIKAISFELLDNKSGNFELLSVKTEKVNEKPAKLTSTADINENTFEHFYNDQYTVGIDILHGGVVTELYANNSTVEARVYNIDGKNVTKVDYAAKLDAEYGTNYISRNTSVNLINLNDPGRYLQQSYYGTGEKPYDQGYYNNADWNYNPVQAGNVAGEASKVIDYEINYEENYIYVKTRPLDWPKWSDDFASDIIEKQSAVRDTFKITNPAEVTDTSVKRYGEDYVTDTYVESKYVFEDGMIKVYNRMVDYSGLPSAQTTQELPAFYTIEPLNQYVYNEVSSDNAWKTKNLKYYSEPEFWGISDQAYLDAWYEGGRPVVNRETPEHWSAFMASDDTDSFGIGLYSPEVTDFYYGIYPPKYQTAIPRNAQTADPGLEVNTSYIAPIGVRTFQSYNPTEYEYYISTGTVEQIRNSFGVVDDEEFAAEHNKTQIGVPETIYMTPSTGASTTGQYFINNLIDATGTLTAEAKNNATNGVISVYSPGSTAVKFNVKALNGGIGDPVFGGGTNSYEDTRWENSVIYGYYGTGAAQDWFVFNALEFWINGTGLSAKGTALLEWEVTVYYGNNDQTGKTYYAYTTLYSPNYHSVGATSEARHSDNNRIDSAGWISGVHSVTTSLAPFGKSSGEDGTGVFKSEPILNLSVPMVQQGWKSANNLTSSSDGKYVREFYYNTGKDSSHMQSYTGVLYVDYSRNKNTNTIPNVYIGADLLGADHSTNDTGCHGYAWYALGTGSEFQNPSGNNPSPSGGTWTKFMDINSTSGNYNATVVKTTSDNLNLTSFRDILNYANSGRAVRWYTAPNLAIKESGTQYIYLYSQMRVYSDKYANTYSAVKIETVNKGELRDLVLQASALEEANYTSSTWSAFRTALKNAANELGNPTDADVTSVTNELKSKMNALQTVVKLDGNGGTVSTDSFNVTVGANMSFDYDASAYTATNGPAGYSFAGWSTDKYAETGSTVVKAGLMPTLYAVWTENTYTVNFNANGGSGSVASKTVKYSESFVLPSYEFMRDGYKLIGWSTSASATTAEYALGQTITGLANSGTVTLYAVWQLSKSINVTFDNLIDFDAWNKTTNNGTVKDITDTGFTIVSANGAGESCSSSPYFAVEPGKTYEVSMDITGDGWDVYIFFCDASGRWIDFSDGPTNRYSSNGTGYQYIADGNSTTAYFTAPNKSEIVQAQIRVDANASNNTVRFDNIRVSEVLGISVDPVNKYVSLNSTYGELPFPERNGFEFTGWYDANGNQVTSSTVMTSLTTVFLKSEWNITDDALNEDAVIVDFGMPVTFNPVENDEVFLNEYASYTLNGISTDGETIVSSVDGAYGTFTVAGNSVTYTPDSIMNGSDVIYYHITSGSVSLKSTVTAIPATVVYYEDDFGSVVDYIDGVATSGNTGKWSETGNSSFENAAHNLSDAVYGYSGIYAANEDNLSMGTAHIVSVSQKNNPKGKYNGVADNAASWPVAEFTFAGTGFDLVSLISKETGSVEVKVIGSDGKTKFDWVVDTYYGYKLDAENKWVVDAEGESALYQIPVISRNDLPYDTYTVQIIPTYSSRLDHQGDGAYDFYLDAVRVYNPMGTDKSAALVYASQGEFILSHQTIRNILVNAGDLDVTSAEDSFVYINKNLKDGTFEQYELVGPKSEVYLKKGQSVAFKLTVKGKIPASVQISAHSVDGEAAMVFGANGSNSAPIAIAHKTALYYNAPFVGDGYWTDNGDGSFTTRYPLVISNSGDGVLALCNIKVTSDEAVASAVTYVMDRNAFAVATDSAENLAGLTPDDGALFVPEDVEAGSDSDMVEVGETVVVSIETSDEVAALTVNGENAVLVSENEDGTKTWSYTYTTTSRGEETFTLVAYNSDGFASEETTVTVEVKSRIEIFFLNLTQFFRMVIEFLDNLFGN